MTPRKKLIEVSLPLEAINKESPREKSIRHGHPSTLHLWWSRKPLAACRAVLFSSLVDDPSEYMPTMESARVERERLFDIIEDLVIWENSNNEEVLDKARMEIARSVARNLNVDVPVGKEAVREFLATKAPPIFDPFAGGGSIPLEAQRLGLRAYASDLNPIAVLINKALIEIPPKFADMLPIHPADSDSVSMNSKKGRKKKVAPQDEFWKKEWKGSQGLADDVRYYGKWMRNEAFERFGHLYPPITITKEMLAERSDLKELGIKTGDQLTVIAWLWARTVTCPNPACGAQMPLISKYWLRSNGNNQSWLEYKVDGNKKIVFKVKVGKAPTDSNLSMGTCFVSNKGKKVKATFLCPVCRNGVAKGAYIDSQANSVGFGAAPLSVVAEWKNSRVFLEFNEQKENSEILALLSELDVPSEPAKGTFASNAQGRIYGFKSFSDYFLPRQLVALSMFSRLILETQDRVYQDGINQNLDPQKAKDYSNAIATYLALLLDKGVNLWSSLSSWMGDRGAMRETFSQQGIAMSWDFAEANPFSDAGGGVNSFLEKVSGVIEMSPSTAIGQAVQGDAAKSLDIPESIIATDPPYYENVSYADIMDFFYVWLKRSLSTIYSDLFQTTLTPKAAELVATPYRFNGDKIAAKEFFEEGLYQSFTNIFKIQNHTYPAIVFYAYKQTEDEIDEESEEAFTLTASTGWETMLEGLIKSGFTISGTWPIRTESSGRSTAIGSNSLASSVVISCRPRLLGTPSTSRREFLSFLKKELAPALRELQQGSIAPVDLAQAAIGPGMAVFSRYSAVLEADGNPMSVRTALTLINQALDEFLAEQEGEYDGDTRWALTWFEQYGHNEAAYGVAETLSRAKNTSVDGLSEAGIVEARGGKVRLYKREELDTDWDPTQDKRLTAWESAAHLIYALENGGEESAAELLAKLGPVAEVARDLAYRLYTVCERKGWAQDALGYNSLVVAWPRLKELAARKEEPGQAKLL